MSRFQQQEIPDLKIALKSGLSSSEASNVSMPRMNRVAIDSIKVEDVQPTERNKIAGTKYTIKLERDPGQRDPLVEELPHFTAKLQPALGKDQRFTYLQPPKYDPATKELSYVLYPLRSLNSAGDVFDKPRDLPAFSQMKFLPVTSESEVARVRITPNPKLAADDNDGALNETRRINIASALEDYIGKTYDLENPPAMESRYKVEGENYILSIKLKDKQD